METNQAYYARRAVAERVAASEAKDARSRHAHLDLAARFDLLAAAIGEVDSKIGSQATMHSRAAPRLIRL